MSCRLMMTLLSEHQEGECGEDWRYRVEAIVLGEGSTSEGHIDVPRHVLPSGANREPFGNPDPVEVYSGVCLTELKVRLNLTATEEDVFVDDVGNATMEFKLECPGPGASTLTKDVDITAGVREAPVILNKDAIFSVGVRFRLMCD